MKKVKTEYVFSIEGKKDWTDDVKLEVNEEFPEHIRLTIYQERWRTKEDFIKLYEGIINELINFINNKI